MKATIGRRNFGVVWVCIAVLCLMPKVANCRTITVRADGSGDYPTIQDAIDDCNDGDIIACANGVYTGPGNRDIDFLGKAITVRSTDPNDPNNVAATIIDCQGTSSEPHRGFYFHSGENTNSIVGGFTITNGYGPSEVIKSRSRSRGGAILCKGSSPIIKNCIIKGNSARYGGGIFFYSGNLKITNCTISSNSTFGTNPSISHGGGIYCYGNATISNCTFSNNHSGRGAGLYCDRTAANAIVTNCTFTANIGQSGGGAYSCGGIGTSTFIDCTINNNIADGPTGTGGGLRFEEGRTCKLVRCSIFGNSSRTGGGVHFRFCNPVVENCLITGNTAERNGGGIWMENANGSSAVIRNSFISNNTARQINAGGIYSSNIDTVLLNCSVVGNSADDNGGGIFHNYSTSEIRNCIFWDNESLVGPELYVESHSHAYVSYCNVQGGWPGEGNIDADPCFVTGPEGDYYLSQIAAGQAVNSPSVDTGSDTADNLGLDIFTTRIDHVGDAGIVDMGYHYGPINTDPVACIVGGEQTVEAGSGCEARVTLDGSCSSDADSTPGTNDDINDFDWYDVVDVCDPNSDIYLGSGEIIECNLPLGEHTIILEVTDEACAFDTNEVIITVEDTTPPVITLNGSDTVVLECGVDSYMEPGATAMDICDGDVAVVIGGDTVNTLTCGTYEVTYDATDATGNPAEQVIRTVIVEDTILPEFSLSVEPDVLWPANHKMVKITPSWEVSDSCDELPEVTLVNITMDDDEAKGNGHRTDDIEVGDDGIRLRAERSGTGSGRVYTITYRAVDDCNNVSIDSATVTVPHDRRKH